MPRQSSLSELYSCREHGGPLSRNGGRAGTTGGHWLSHCFRGTHILTAEYITEWDFTHTNISLEVLEAEVSSRARFFFLTLACPDNELKFVRLPAFGMLTDTSFPGTHKKTKKYKELILIFSFKYFSPLFLTLLKTKNAYWACAFDGSDKIWNQPWSVAIRQNKEMSCFGFWLHDMSFKTSFRCNYYKSRKGHKVSSR